MNSNKERDIATTPAGSRPDESGGASSASGAAAESTTISRDTPSGEENRDISREIGGRAGPDPARYGDWEKNGRCIDF